MMSVFWHRLWKDHGLPGSYAQEQTLGDPGQKSASGSLPPLSRLPVRDCRSRHGRVSACSRDTARKLAVVSPYAGYVEAECNERIAAQTKDWPAPSVVGPVEGTRLEAQLQLPNCNYSVKDQHDMWANSEAILYLGVPDSLTVSAMDPNIYLDLDYFNEENRLLRCCTPNEPLDWDKLFQGG